MSRYTGAIPQPLCRKKNHKFIGIVSNQLGTEPFDSSRPHASTSVCGRAECIDDAREWVQAHTREDGVFTTFEQNRAASAGRSAGADQ
ncbi:hypothetical protein [Pseudonocardia sp. NPDC049635]|uniref:hypothetical protein n=1 Tax=Pseudonocardia sp. NPDC049635 TaxID=3155506 RepID=UPI003401DCE6